MIIIDVIEQVSVGMRVGAGEIIFAVSSIVINVAAIALSWGKLSSKVEVASEAVCKEAAERKAEIEAVQESCDKAIKNQFRLCDMKIGSTAKESHEAYSHLKGNHDELKAMLVDNNNLLKSLNDNLVAHIAYHKGVESKK